MYETNLYSITIPPMIKSLTALSSLVDKIESHAQAKQSLAQPSKTQVETLLNSRLIADQFPFIRQVQIACDNAKGGAARLAEIENPKFEDTEKTTIELKERINKTIVFLETIKPEQIIGKEAVKISLPSWEGKSLHGFEYVTKYLMANFYFHVATAYSILRSNGLTIGKSDYIGGLPLKDL